MLTATIHIDGQAYQGEDHEILHEISNGALGTTYNIGPVHGLKFGEQPKRIVGQRNLRSEMDRIFNRLNDGHISATRIEIVLEPAPAV